MIAPTLLIGLGGTGSKIVMKVANLVSDAERERISFAVFDTDINELAKIQEANPYIKTIQTSTRQTVGEYLNRDLHARDEWFPVNSILNGKTLTEGAGQVRSISRIALDSAIRAGKMEPLHEAIQSLYKVEEGQGEQALRVTIVSSLAGGTGSGLLLPVALYVKNYLNTRLHQSANITRGFFILPEVFDDVIPGHAERNNLRANAYATLRELDAFLMKGDATLDPRYADSVRILFPSVVSSEYEEYDVRPYEFCFLFDAQNAEGSKLNSFEQNLDHAANCIYAQSIGPMNKRSNSSEDNTIRRLCAEKGRNRYAGAGSSMLIYPVEDIKSYIALMWAKECVSDRWLIFDRLYKELSKRNAEMRAQGLSPIDTSAAANYVITVEQMAKDRKPFARAIVRSCKTYSEDGLTERSDKWDDYLFALEKKIKEDMTTGQGDLEAEKNNVTTALSAKSQRLTWRWLKTGYNEVVRYRSMVEKRVEETSQTIAYTIFKAGDADMSDRQPYNIETYLYDAEGSFIHPNAVRYFLYKALENFKAKKVSVDAEVKNLRKYFDNFAGDHFDDQKTEDVVEVSPDILDKKKDPAVGNARPEQIEFLENLNEYVSKIDAYRVKYTLGIVLQEGIDYIKALADAFQSFFMSFESKVASMEKRINTLHKKHENTKGMTTRYVCATSKCLDKMYEDMPYTGSSITIDGKLAKEIFGKVRSYATLSNKPKNESYFGKLFEDGILKYFEDLLMELYRDALDLDILSALEKEATYELNEYDDSRVDIYVRNVISETRALSCPFIEKSLSTNSEYINACAYNPILRPDDDSPRSLLVDKELKNFGGVDDKDISKNMILFYQSFYGLRANDLSKFAPPEKAMTYKREGGEYFKAYFDLVSRIHPESHRSPEISPHIDRWWHIVTKMPDLDEGNQLRQEQEICAAFFWGLLGGYIDLYDENAEQRVYKLKVDALKLLDDRLVVSNGTSCDRLYEVLDAISIYPALVRRILDKVEDMSLYDLNEKKSLEDGILFSFLESFTVKEYWLLDENGEEEHENFVRSIFDIPMLMKKSATPDQYYEEGVLGILRAEIAEIRRYLSKFCSAKELPDVMGGILRDQFDKYLRDVKIESKQWPSIYRESLFDRTCTIISEAFEDLSLINEARTIQKKVAELRR